MQVHWTKHKDGRNHHVDLTRPAGKVTVTDETGHWKSENGVSVTYEEFLEGKCQGFVLVVHGKEVLAEVIASVKEMLEK